MGNSNNIDTLDQLQNAIIKEGDAQKKSGIKEYQFDKLKLYFGDDYEVVKNIKISQPKIGDILDIGEQKFYHSLSPFLYNSTSIRLFLWERQVDWFYVKDIQVFAMLIPTVEKEPLQLLFKDISFDDFKLLTINGESEDTKFILYSPSQNLLISEEDYMTMAEYIRTIMNVHPKVEKPKNKTARKWIIQEDRMNLQQREKSDNSTLLPLISTCVNHPGFKYKLQELRDVGIYQFMDSMERLQIYESTHALFGGIYSGFCDTSKISKEQFNFFRDIS